MKRANNSVVVAASISKPSPPDLPSEYRTSTLSLPPVLKSRVLRVTRVSSWRMATAACSASGSFQLSVRRKVAARSAISEVIGKAEKMSSSSRATGSAGSLKPVSTSARVITEMPLSLACSPRNVEAASIPLK